MAKVIYTAKAHVTGGRMHGQGRSSDGELDVAIRPPKELGGEGGGTNPEQLFAVGFAACFESALTSVAQRAKIDADKLADAAIDASVSLVTGENRSFNIAVDLAVSLPSLPDEEATELVRTAHAVCPYSNATRGNIDITLSVNGAPLEEPAAA